MKTYYLLLPVLCLLCGCYTRNTEPREPYTLRGYVSDCSTGKPLAGVTINLVASSRPAGMGFFGPTQSDAGTTVTDDNGNYAIIPFAYSFTEVYYVDVSKEGYQQNRVSVDKEDIPNAGGNTYKVDSLCITQ